MFSLKYLFLRFKRSAPLAPSYNPMPRVNKGHLFIYFLRRLILQIEKKLIMKNDTYLCIFLLINIFMMCASLPLSYSRSGETGNLVDKVNQISTFETPFGLKLQINPIKTLRSLHVTVDSRLTTSPGLCCHLYIVGM